jgi:hypothetical protein
MRKYLMTGVAVLALSAAFTSCSKSDELYNPEVVKGNEATTIVEKYNQAFTKYVGGTISPDQTWGFGGYSAGTRAENPDANKWLLMVIRLQQNCQHSRKFVLWPISRQILV